MLKNLKIGILGCGWLGSRMANKWKENNIIYCTTTTNEKIDKLEKEGLNPTLIDFSDTYFSSKKVIREVVELPDVLVITVPLSTRKEMSFDSVVNKLKNLIAFIRNFNGQIFFLSSTSVYPNDVKEFKEEDVDIESNIVENYL